MALVLTFILDHVDHVDLWQKVLCLIVCGSGLVRSPTPTVWGDVCVGSKAEALATIVGCGGHLGDGFVGA